MDLDQRPNQGRTRDLSLALEAKPFREPVKAINEIIGEPNSNQRRGSIHVHTSFLGSAHHIAQVSAFREFFGVRGFGLEKKESAYSFRPSEGAA